MASSSTSFVQKSFKYDVFLSFRGEDTRKSFVDHLYHALVSRGIITYKDDEKIEKGKRINDQLIRSIENSKFYIVVFSKNYASSSWCLEELVKIMECQRMEEHTAYIIFYDVEPTEIRKQIGSVGKAFSKFEKEETAGKWRDALQAAAGLAGWELKNTANGHEAQFIQKIVKEISPMLLCNNLSVDEELVGMEERVKEVVLSLETGNNDVRMIGIKGMGGAGKTTLARAVFDHMSMVFEGSSFVENVREVSDDSSKGLMSLQQQLLSDVNNETISVSSVFDGKNKLKRMLGGKKVLIVLDDVNCIDQLNALAGERKWFMPGSRIIITTRDEKVLPTHRVDFILNVNLLSDNEAICLFSRYAFGKDIPVQGYEELSEKVVCYAAGLPLTLKVLGSYLCGVSDDVWRDALERLKTIPLKETLKILEISYDGLEVDYRDIFLDVACIFKGWEENKAISALESCGFHAKIGLKVLQQRSLITIIYNPSEDQRVLGMHDHIEEMGQNIVRRSAPDEPHKHSRLWKMNEIEDILAKDKGTEETRCVQLMNWEWKIHPATIMKGLRKMKRLRFLHVEDCLRGRDDVFYLEDQESYVQLLKTTNLQYLYWRRYPLTCSPWSNRRQFLEGGKRKVLDKVKYINICSYKLRTFDLESTPNLETLILTDCYDLEEVHMKVLDKLKYFKIHDSKLTTLDLRLTQNLETLILINHYELVELHMGVLDKVTHIDLTHSRLDTFDLGQTPNLETLILRCCFELKEFHLHSENTKLKFLDLSFSSNLKIIHLGRSRNLEVLSLKQCHNLEELHMPAGSIKLLSLSLVSYATLRTLGLLRTLNLDKLHISNSGCGDLEKKYRPGECLRLRTMDLSQIRNLEEITIEYCDLVELSMPIDSRKLKTLKLFDSKLRTLRIGSAPNLQTLILKRCSKLEEIHMQDLDKVTYIDLSNCYELRTLNLGPTPNLETLTLPYCYKLVELHKHGETPKLKFLNLLCNTHLKIIHLVKSPNIEELSLENCQDLEELHMPTGSVKLKSLRVNQHYKLRTLDLSQTLNLEKLYIAGCDNLVQLHLPAELKSLCLKYSRLSTLDLAQIKNLEEIIIEHCKDLIELHMPVDSLMLKTLKISNSKLRTLDLTQNLETLIVKDCHDLEELHMQVRMYQLNPRREESTLFKINPRREESTLFKINRLMLVSLLVLLLAVAFTSFLCI